MNKKNARDEVKKNRVVRAASRMKNVYVFCSIQLATVVLLYVLLEAGVRIFLEPVVPVDINSQTVFTAEGQEPYFQYHPFAAFSWIPHAKFLRQTVNSKGFVSTREIPFEKEDNEIRIITLGGSSTVGNGNIDEYTYPRVLERLLQEEFPDKKITVINGAAGGYSTIESLGYLQTRLLYYKPDIILVMHAWNDMYYFSKSNEEISQWRKDFNLQVMWNTNVSSKLEDMMPKDLQYLSWSQLYLHIREFTRKGEFFNKDQGADTIEKRYDNLEMVDNGLYRIKSRQINTESFDVYRKNLEQILNVCRINDIKCFSVLQPMLILGKVNMESSKIKKSIRTAAVYHGFGYKEHVMAYSKIYAINRLVFGEKNIIDPTKMNGHEALFDDHIHQSYQGTHILAAFVFDKVKKAVDVL